MMGGVYFAYPIDQRGPSSLVYLFDMIEYLKQQLLSTQAVGWAYDPGDAFKVSPGAKIDDSVARINRVALLNADTVIAFLPANVPSIGVPMEIDRAVSQGKNVIIVSDAPSWMLQYNSQRVWRFTDYDQQTMEGIVDLAKRLQPPPMEMQQEDLPVKLGDGGMMPVRQYDDDAGFDLFVSHDVAIAPGQFLDVPCSISVELPPWSWGMVTGRSSTLRKKGLLVHPGVIDAGYRGPLFAGAWNTLDKVVEIKRGERIAQLIVLSNMSRHVMPIETMQLTDSQRGVGGFGSTGA